MPIRAVDKPQTKRDKSEASIDRILESALSLIVTRGFNATTVDDIAKKAGLTKGAIYFHFENKTAILLALLDVIDKLVLGSLMDRVMHAGPTSKDKLVAALHSQGMLAETKTKYLLLFTLTLLEFNGTDTPIETRVKAIYDGFAHLKEGGAPDALKDRVASSEMLRAVDRTEEFRQWQRDYLKD